ncbi:MAG: DsrE family protein [Arenimonas sp.]
MTTANLRNGAAHHGAKIAVCGTCMDTRGISETELAEGTKHSTLDTLTHTDQWAQWADKMLAF